MRNEKPDRLWQRIAAHFTKPLDPPYGPMEMMPAADFRRVVLDTAGDELGALGWERDGREWIRKLQPWATAVVEFRSLKGGGMAVRWGLRFSFVPKVKARSRVGDLGPEDAPLHLSYDPTDYEVSTREWALSRFSTEEELVRQAKQLARQASDRCNKMCSCTSDIEALLQCFEDKKSRKAVAFEFRHYPHEVLAYCVVLGWVGREAEAQEYLEDLIERSSLSAKKAESMMTEVRTAWLRGSVL